MITQRGITNLAQLAKGPGLRHACYKPWECSEEGQDGTGDGFRGWYHLLSIRIEHDP